MSSPVMIPATGQTLEDLVMLNRLAHVSNLTYFTPPSFTNPNYVPPRQNRTARLAIVYTGMATATILVVTKVILTQRGRSKRVPYLEDWLLLLGLVLGWVFTTFSLVMENKYQVGMHAYDVHYSSLVGLFQSSVVNQVVCVWTYVAIRLALLMGIRRLYSPLRTCMQRVCDILCFLKLVAAIVSTYTVLYADPSHPYPAWDLSTAIKHGRLGTTEQLVGASITALILDIIVLLSPLPLVFHLKDVPRRRKLQFVAIYSFGFLTVICSAIRVWEIVRLKEKLLFDPTWYIHVLSFVAALEIELALITTCLPTASFFFTWAYSGTPRLKRTQHKLSTLSTFDSSYNTSILSSTFSYDAKASYNRDSMVEIQSAPVVSVQATTSKVPRHKPSIAKANDAPVITQTIVKDEEEDDDDNFYEVLAPSDNFFPAATQLTPRPRAPPASAFLHLRSEPQTPHSQV